MEKLRLAVVHFMDTYALPGVQWIIAWVASWLIGMEPALWLYIGLVVVDVITGVMASVYQGKPITSREWTRGLITKAGILILCLLGHGIEMVVTLLLGTPMELRLERWLPLGFAFGEIISIIENLYKCDVYIPKPLVELLIKGKKAMVASATKADMDELLSSVKGEPTEPLAQAAVIAEKVTAEKPKETVV